ncbi:MAG: amidase [Acidobacteriota bacterium]
MTSRTPRTDGSPARGDADDPMSNSSTLDFPTSGTEGASGGISRRRVLGILGALGAAGPALLARAQEGAAGQALSVADVAAAERLAGLELTAEEREMLLAGVSELAEQYEAVRALAMPNSVIPALRFDPEAASGRGGEADDEVSAPLGEPRGALEGVPWRGDEDLAFAPLRAQAFLLRSGQRSAQDLLEVYRRRMERYDPELHCVIHRTDDRAQRLAKRADAEILSGTVRGPLHGLPWGAKDLLSVSGYPTTWGATPYQDQVIDHDAAVVRRLDAAGAVLGAKLSLGALAWGDVWHRAMTRNPWNTEEGSSGSSAGSASAVAAGLVSFAIGSETWGSIVSPSTRCGTTGLRPTFGRISRDGAMTLSWSMDKLGPIARSADDCGLVFSAICGRGRGETDPTVVDRSFHGPAPPASAGEDLEGLRIGYLQTLFDSDPAEGVEDEGEAAMLREWREFDRRALAAWRELGATLEPVSLPDLPWGALSTILSAEAAAAFDDLTRDGRDDQLVRQVVNAWPNAFRQARFIPAVEYVQANRARTVVMGALQRSFEGFDAIIAPTFGANQVLLTNLTGHPAVVFPHGFREQDGTPASITVLAPLFGEAGALRVARAFQRATDFHRRRPSLTGEATVPYPEGVVG